MWRTFTAHEAAEKHPFNNPMASFPQLRHVFTELVPLPLGPMAEKPPLNLTDPVAWLSDQGLGFL